ncbi:ABC transporter permease [Ktedonosporobacter rubrisoli]|uniref:ABC transporter permease n=1 Tax=Ktedonosporobacter rubrisoli TaxID=2509675 RepID=A0A4P6JPJ4_KTERU|nr:ABC transporter permease [Ktedonosporobacter rubrisoli]QBD77060.1 ABC transporter permease [Ktedonosporobacter rubrisoli]
MSALANTPVSDTPTPLSSPTSSRLHSFLKFWVMNRKVSLGSAILAIFLLMAIIGPALIHQDPNAMTNDLLQPPSAAHWLGTTQTGQDVLAQVIVGARISVFMGLAIGLVTTTISVIIGLLSGYFGGWIDEFLSLASNVFLVIPTLPLAILMAAFISYKGVLTIGFVLTITGWSWSARILRAQTLTWRGRDCVEAARASGESLWRIVFFEIFPNEIAIVAAQFLGTVIYAILAETGLEYLGLGDITSISWGTMLYWASNNDALMRGAWWWFIAPGLCIALLGAGLTFINFGIDEIANPRLRGMPKLKRLKAKLLHKEL